MNTPVLIRLAIAVAISLGLAVLLWVLFYATELGFEIWDRLTRAPPWFAAAYVALLLLLVGFAAYWLWRLLKPRRRGIDAVRPAPPRPPPTEAGLRARLEGSASTGADTSAAGTELAVLSERRAAGQVHVALFGEMSTGKSSLIKALLPACEVAIDPRGGTTRKLTRYTWVTPEGDRLILTDMPGLNATNKLLEDLSREEAQRAHVVIYLVNGDLTRDQYAELQQLLALDKPVILALNKVDQLSAEDLAAVRQRLMARVGSTHDVEIVPVCAGGQREIIKVHADGREELALEEIPARVEALIRVMLRRMRRDPEQLERLRDAAVVQLADRKLDASLAAHRRQRSEELINQYTRYAVLGALATVSPGTDIIIQGYLAIAMVRAHCNLYEVPMRDVDIDRFWKQASRDVGKTLPLLMAATGNALKAFPGMGTLAGGLLHAVGYGLIFESLGRAVATILEQRGDLMTAPTLRLFEENLGDDLEARARRLGKLALGQGRRRSAGR